MSRIPWAVSCKATRRDGTPCGAYAIRGGTVCRMHGGAAPQVKEAAARRLFEDRLARHAARWDAMHESRKDALVRTYLGLGDAVLGP